MLALTRAAARRLQVAAQGLDRRPRRRARKADVLAAIRRMGALQIDTISVVARSPYLVLFSRLGAYDPQWLDELLAEGALFEYWAHEACFLPIEHYALFRHRMLDPAGMGWKYRAEWVSRHGHELDRVLQHLRAHGATRAAEFERREGSASGWWEWKPEKRALESLFTAGEVMVARRQSFQRVYDLRERVYPAWRDDAAPDRVEAERMLVLSAVRALGVCRARQVADYYRMDRRRTPGIVHALAADGLLLRVRIEGGDEPGFIHPDHADLAERAAAGGVRCTLTTVLSPFDPLVWDRGRARDVFGFDYVLECYTPAARRRFGYFVLPLLRRGHLVGRLDAKVHRRERMFEVKTLCLEDGVVADASFIADVAGALREAAAWHAADDVVLRKMSPAPAGRMLRAALAS